MATQLPDVPVTTRERIPPASWGEVRRVIAWTLAWVVVFNLAAIGFLARFSPDRGPRVVRTKWRLIEQAGPDVDWLILGDSSGLRGVVPAVLDARLGVRSLNLNTTRRMLVTSDAWMLSEFIARHGAPKGVLMVHVHEVWHGGRDWLVSAMPDIPRRWGFWERMDPPFPLSPREQFRVFLSRYVPIYGRSQSLGEALQYPWKIGRYHRSIGVDEAGYMPIRKASPKDVVADAQRGLAAVTGQRFVLSGENRQALEHIRALADRHGFDVYIANAPLYEGLARDPVFRAYHRQVQESLRAVVASSPRLRYIAQEPWTFPKEQMENCDHVTAEASPVFTGKLADEILALRRGAGRGGP